MESKRVGLIGVGLLGEALASRLTAAGFAVLGYDIDSGRRSRLESIGGRSAPSGPDVAAVCRRVLLSLPNSEVVLQVLAEIEPRLSDGALVIDTTTGDPEATERTAEHLRKRRVAYLDATVGGSSRQVQTGAAIVMVGGEQPAYDACDDIFDALAGKRFFVGPSGSGARMKLVLNLVLGLNRAVLAEALAFASKYGLAPEQTLTILKSGPAYSKVMETKGSKMLAGSFEAEARLSQHLKDVRLILAAARGCGAKLPLTSVHRDLLESLEDRGFGPSDNSVIIKAFDS